MFFLLTVRVNEVTFTLNVKLNYSDYFQLCVFDTTLNNEYQYLILRFFDNF